MWAGSLECCPTLTKYPIHGWSFFFFWGGGRDQAESRSSNIREGVTRMGKFIHEHLIFNYVQYFLDIELENYQGSFVVILPISGTWILNLSIIKEVLSSFYSYLILLGYWTWVLSREFCHHFTHIQYFLNIELEYYQGNLVLISPISSTSYTLY